SAVQPAYPASLRARRDHEICEGSFQFLERHDKTVQNDPAIAVVANSGINQTLLLSDQCAGAIDLRLQCRNLRQPSIPDTHGPLQAMRAMCMNSSCLREIARS